MIFCSYVFSGYIFLAALKINCGVHIHTFTFSSSHNIYYLLILHVLATEFGHLQGATNFVDIYSIYCKQSYVNCKMYILVFTYNLNPLNAELNPICYLLALLAHHFLHVSGIRVKSLTIRLLMSYIYGAPILDVSRSHTTTHHSRQDSSGRVIGSSQRPLPDNTQHSQQTNIHIPGGIRTHNLSRRAAADLRLRPRGNWDRQSVTHTVHNHGIAQ